MKRIAIIGPAHPLRGGLATFNQRLAREFQNEGHSCELVSFSLQYPSFLFPGTTQYTTDPPPEGLTIHTLINSVNPLNWVKVGSWLRRRQYDIVIVRYWLPVMGPALGTILRILRKERKTAIICIADNVIPHEKRPGDRPFTRYFLDAPHAFVTMSEKVLADLKTFEPHKQVQLVSHPLYDAFGEPMAKSIARQYLALPQSARIILFFGFIRKYKGLDLLLQAMADPWVADAGITLLVAGEFYEEAQPYLDQVQQLGLADRVVLKTVFIPDEEVKYYLCAADAVIQPYRNATQSGVTPLAYHFDKPMVVTNVGGLPALVPHERAGLVCEPHPPSIAAAIRRFYELGEHHFLPHLRVEKQKYSWGKLTSAIHQMAENVSRPPSH